MKENTFKAVISLALAGLSVYFQTLMIPIAILIFVMICDYVSGMAIAWINRQLSSRTGIIGILKKVCYLLTVTVGMVADWVVQTALLHVGVEIQKGLFLFGMLVTIWLIINELLSILENLTEIGVPLPPFLTPLIKRLKRTVEKKADEKNENTEAE